MHRKTSNLKITLIIALLTLSIISCKKEKNETISAEPKRDSSWALLPFVKADSANPILMPGQNTFVCPIIRRSVLWDEKDVFNPAAVVRDDKVYMIFRAEDKIGKHAGTSRLGLAVSDDGITFTKMKEPVFFPNNDSLKIY